MFFIVFSRSVSQQQMLKIQTVEIIRLMTTVGEHTGYMFVYIKVVAFVTFSHRYLFYSGVMLTWCRNRTLELSLLNAKKIEYLKKNS